MIYQDSSRCLGIVIAALCSAMVAHAQVVTVGPVGSAAQYNSIADGIAAVPSGGTVLVAAGAYSQPHGGLFIDKPMTLLGAGSGQTSFEVASGLVNLPVPLTIAGLATGEDVVVAGIQLSAQSTFFGTLATAVTIRDCAGIVAMTDVQGVTISARAADGVVVVHNAALVTMDGCRFITEHSLVDLSTPGIAVTDSVLHVTDCVIRGGSTEVSFGATTAEDGANGIVATGSIVRLARSVVTGGAGAAPSPISALTTVTNGGAAVAAVSSQVLVRGASGNLLQGGKGGRTGTGPLLFGAGGSAIQLDAASLATTTPDVVMASGLDGDDQLTTATVSGAGLHGALAFPLPVLTTTDKLVAPGGVVSFDVTGEPGAVCLSLLATQQTSAFAFPGILGVFTLQFPAVVPLPVVTLDPAGAANFSVQLPSNPALVGIAAYSQSVSFAPSGWIAVSPSASFVVR